MKERQEARGGVKKVSIMEKGKVIRIKNDSVVVMEKQEWSKKYSNHVGNRVAQTNSQRESLGKVYCPRKRYAHLHAKTLLPKDQCRHETVKLLAL